MLIPWDRQPFFDPEIVSRHLSAEFFLEHLEKGFQEGMTDEDVRSLVANVNVGASGKRSEEAAAAMRERILAIMGELRDMGLLKPIPHGAERGLRPVQQWNAFVETGKTDLPAIDAHNLMKCPLPHSLNAAAWSEVYHSLAALRRARGYTRSPGYRDKNEEGKDGPMPVLRSDLPALAATAARGSLHAGAGLSLYVGHADFMTCPKTSVGIHWKEQELLAPSLTTFDPATAGFLALEPFHAPKPLRHVEMILHSGVLLAADWFRLPGFSEGVMGADDRHENWATLGSDLGADNQMKDHFERLGLMRIPTSNCLPAFWKDGDAIRVGRLDDEHDSFWTEAGDQNEAALPPKVGQICCDLWDATFADRETIIDIILAGAEEIRASGAKGRAADEIAKTSFDREEVAARLDAYAAEHDVARLEFEPGTRLHVYMATGKNVEKFARHFRSDSLSDWEFMEDMFVLSTTPLEIDPELVEEAGWAWPERYRVTDDAPAP